MCARFQKPTSFLLQCQSTIPSTSGTYRRDKHGSRWCHHRTFPHHHTKRRVRDTLLSTIPYGYQTPIGRHQRRLCQPLPHRACVVKPRVFALTSAATLGQTPHKNSPYPARVAPVTRASYLTPQQPSHSPNRLSISHAPNDGSGSLERHMVFRKCLAETKKFCSSFKRNTFPTSRSNGQRINTARQKNGSIRTTIVQEIAKIQCVCVHLVLRDFWILSVRALVIAWNRAAVEPPLGWCWGVSHFRCIIIRDSQRCLQE